MKYKNDCYRQKFVMKFFIKNIHDSTFEVSTHKKLTNGEIQENRFLKISDDETYIRIMIELIKENYLKDSLDSCDDGFYIVSKITNNKKYKSERIFSGSRLRLELDKYLLNKNRIKDEKDNTRRSD